jgi:hypothetical protein
VPKVVLQSLILLGATAMAIAGVWMVACPDAAVRRMPEFGEDSTPTQARWAARLTGAVLLFFAWAGYHLVLVEGLHPPDPGDGVGV